MKTKIVLASLLASSSAFAQQADSTLIGSSFQDMTPYIQQQTTQPQTICPSATLQWGVQGVYCKQTISEADTGNEQYLVDQDVSDNSYGSARFTCNNGSWVNTSASCSAPQTVTYNDPTVPTVTQSPYVIPSDSTEAPDNRYCPPNYICGWQIREAEQNPVSNTPSTYDPPASSIYYYQSNR